MVRLRTPNYIFRLRASYSLRTTDSGCKALFQFVWGEVSPRLVELLEITLSGLSSPLTGCLFSACICFSVDSRALVPLHSSKL